MRIIWILLLLLLLIPVLVVTYIWADEKAKLRMFERIVSADSDVEITGIRIHGQGVDYYIDDPISCEYIARAFRDADVLGYYADIPDAEWRKTSTISHHKMSLLTKAGSITTYFSYNKKTMEVLFFSPPELFFPKDGRSDVFSYFARFPKEKEPKVVQILDSLLDYTTEQNVRSGLERKADEPVRHILPLSPLTTPSVTN